MNIPVLALLRNHSQILLNETTSLFYQRQTFDLFNKQLLNRILNRNFTHWINFQYIFWEILLLILNTFSDVLKEIFNRISVNRLQYFLDGFSNFSNFWVLTYAFWKISFKKSCGFFIIFMFNSEFSCRILEIHDLEVKEVTISCENMDIKILENIEIYWYWILLDTYWYWKILQ